KPKQRRPCPGGNVLHPPQIGQARSRLVNRAWTIPLVTPKSLWAQVDAGPGSNYIVREKAATLLLTWKTADSNGGLSAAAVRPIGTRKGAGAFHVGMTCPLVLGAYWEPTAGAIGWQLVATC